MSRKRPVRGLGVAPQGKKIWLFYCPSSSQTTSFRVETSTNGLDFSPAKDGAVIISGKNRKERLGHGGDFRISDLGHRQYFLTYQRGAKKAKHLCGALSQDFIHWQKTGRIASVKEVGMVVPRYRYKNQFVLYFGEKAIKIAFSLDLKKWQVAKKPVFLPPDKRVSEGRIKIGTLLLNKGGILLIYFERRTNGLSGYSLKSVLFDRKEPTKLVWKTEQALWETPGEWATKKVAPIGLVKLKGRLISYWEIESEGIFAISHFPLQPREEPKLTLFDPLLKKFRENPILRPLVDHFWESQYVFNPAAVYEGGKVHLVYRAVGDSAISVFGYAASQDGLHIDERLKEPIYVPREPFESNPQAPVCTAPLMSGGGAGGCEDPRITKIDGRFYMTYVAWDGSSNPRLAITSIAVDDFLGHRWHWERPVLISAPHIIDKNACILPEKIKGKYVVFHRVFPDILIDPVESLDFDGETFLKGEFKIKTREEYWDSRKVAVGPPPIKTEDGWLLIYHAVCDWGAYHYKMGAMVLDLENPTRVLYRSRLPILEPTEKYEYEGYKPGVTYPCGAVTIDDRLFVYYGGADTVICVATARLGRFLTQLKESESAQLELVASPTFQPIYH